MNEASVRIHVVAAQQYKGTSTVYVNRFDCYLLDALATWQRDSRLGRLPQHEDVGLAGGKHMPCIIAKITKNNNNTR